MFRQLIIEDFRCFESLHLKDLARVDLIAGKNNTGKTALLEAIHIHNDPSDCLLPFSINRSRGMLYPDNRSDADIGSWLFFRKRTATDSGSKVSMI